MVRTLDEAKRTAILNAARKVFLRDGFATAKTADIASEAGVAAGTLYLYFKSKEVLLGAVFETLFTNMSKDFARIVDQFKGPSDVSLLVNWSLQIAKERHKMHGAVNENMRPAPNNMRAMASRVLSPALKKLMDQGLVRKYENPVIVSDLVLLTLREIVFSYSTSDEETLQNLKTTTTVFLQHVLFDDVTMAAFRLISSKG